MLLYLPYFFYFACLSGILFWLLIWVMHLTAIKNAQLKFHTTSQRPPVSQSAAVTSLAAAAKAAAAANSAAAFSVNDSPPPPPTLLHCLCINSDNNKNSNSNKQHHYHINKHEEQTTQTKPTTNTSSTLKEVTPSLNGAILLELPTTQQAASANNNYNNDQNKQQQLVSITKSTTTNSTQSSSTSSSLSSYISVPLPGVSIIKPLVGVDENLKLNLASFFTLDYPSYEILFCCQDEKDEAITIVKCLIDCYPHVDAKLFVSNCQIGVNPKINNMQPAYQAAKYGLILISDSGILMLRDTLLDMVLHMEDDVALVHQMPFVCDKTDFHGIVEKVYFGTSHARAYLTADFLNINCSSGMSTLMRKFLIDEVGGLKAFGAYLAEDFFLAKSFLDRGWRAVISSQPAWQNEKTADLTRLNSRISRWIKLRLFMVPHWTILEPFTECALLGVVAATSINFIFGYNILLVFTFHVLFWIILDYVLLTTIQNGPLAFNKFQFLSAWILKESCALLIYLKTFTDLNVRWKTRVFKLHFGGEAEEVFKK